MRRTGSFAVCWLLLLAGIVCLSFSERTSAFYQSRDSNYNVAIASGSSTTTLDPTFINAVTLSNGNLTVTSTTGANNIARSIAAHSSGKYYWEVAITTTGNPITGLVSATEVDTNYISQTGKSAGIFAGSGWLGGGTLSGTCGAPIASVSHTFGIALDATNKLAWAIDITGGSGQWNTNATANPATGVNGCNFSASSDLGTSTVHAAITLNTTGDSATFNFGGSSYAGTAPAAFGNL